MDYDKQSTTLLGVVAHRIHDILEQENEGMAHQRSNEIAEAVLDELNLSRYADWDHQELTIGLINVEENVKESEPLKAFSEEINENLNKESSQ